MWNKQSLRLTFLISTSIFVTSKAHSDLGKKVATTLKPPVFAIPPGAQAGWAVRDALSDSMLESQDAHRNLTPASIQKLYTTWLALDLLGPDKTFATSLAYTGKIEKGVLQGDLFIQGGGDPSLGYSQFDETQSSNLIFNFWLGALKQFGIQKIAGCVIGNGTFLLEHGPHPALIWEDAGNYYAGITSGLSYNGNIYTAQFAGAEKIGEPVALVGTYPKHLGISSFENHLLTGPKTSSDSAYILGGFPGTIRELRGTYPAGQNPFFIKGSLPNPAWTCAREFHDFLSSQSVAVESSGANCGDSTKLPNYSTALNPIPIPNSTHISPPLKDLIRFTNQKSDNNFAAQIFALVGKLSGSTADWRGGLLVLNEYLQKRGFNSSEYHFKDGNGLSRYNWVSPAQTSHLLAYAATQKNFSNFQNSLLTNYSDVNTLPIDKAQPSSALQSTYHYIKSLSWTGTKLEKYGTGWEEKLWVKTGTLEGVSSLAGYLKTKSGRLLAFSISVNNFDGKGSEMQKSFGLLLREWDSKY